MKKIIIAAVFAAAIITFASCEKDQGKTPNISFKTGTGYVSASDSLTADTTITIGINASKAEDKDVLKKFNISRSVNNSPDTTIFQKDLSGSEGDNYSYDLVRKLGSKKGQKEKYTFTVTNRDGLVGQVSLTLSIKYN